MPAVSLWERQLAWRLRVCRHFLHSQHQAPLSVTCANAPNHVHAGELWYLAHQPAPRAELHCCRKTECDHGGYPLQGHWRSSLHGNTHMGWSAKVVWTATCLLCYPPSFCPKCSTARNAALLPAPPSQACNRRGRCTTCPVLGAFMKDKMCYLCPEKCLRCTLQTGVCTSCKKGFVLLAKDNVVSCLQMWREAFVPRSGTECCANALAASSPLGLACAVLASPRLRRWTPFHYALLGRLYVPSGRET